MNVNIFLTYRFPKMRPSGEVSFKTFLKTSVLAWGIPVILVLAYFIVSDMFLNDPSTWPPTSKLQSSTTEK